MIAALKGRRGGVPLIPLLGISAAAIFGLLLFVNAGTLLVVSDPVPPRLDIVFTFAGENPRVAYSKKLMGQFPGAHWVLSDYDHLFPRILDRDGFDLERVTFLDTSTNTQSEVNGLRDWINSHRDSLDRTDSVGALQVGLVSNPLHMRRIKFMAQSVFRDSPVVLHYLPVPLEKYHWTRQDILYWWQSAVIRNWVKSETGKLLAFWFFS